MGAKGTKIRQIARELNVTSRQIIDRCRAEGYPAQNSISKLDASVEQAVRSWFAGSESEQQSDPE